MEKKRSLGFTVCTLGNAMKRRIDERISRCVPCVTTRTHGWVIAYLADHEGEEIFQRDIEAQMGVRRSTVTGILQLMEKNGLIVREPVARDARLKKLSLTPKAREAHMAIRQTIEQNEREMMSCLTPEEQETFFALADKLTAGINAQDNEECQNERGCKFE